MKKTLLLTICLAANTTLVYAANSGTPLDQSALWLEQFASGPVALLLIVVGVAASVLVWVATHHFGQALGSFAAAIIGGVILSNLQTFQTLIWPLAGAVIR